MHDVACSHVTNKRQWNPVVAFESAGLRGEARPTAMSFTAAGLSFVTLDLDFSDVRRYRSP